MLSPSQTNDKVIALWREPMQLGAPTLEMWGRGCTVLDIVGRMKSLPHDFVRRGVVIVNDREIPFEDWGTYRPEVYTRDNQSIVTFHMPLQGGKGGAKGIFGIIASIALIFVTAGIASGALLGTLSATLGTSLGISAGAGQSLLAAGVSLVGSLAVSALSAPPVSNPGAAIAPTNSSGSTTDMTAASISGNTLQPNAAIPTVIGTRRLYPPFAFEPITEIIGQDEIVSAVFCLAGPHLLTDIRLDNATISPEENDSDLVILTYDGRPATPLIAIPDRQARTYNLGTQMSVHGVSPDDQSAFVGPLPVFHATATADTPDEAWLHILLSGLVRQADTTQFLRIPFRIRMRLRGDTDWRDLPEVHYLNCTQAQRRLQFKFNFTGPFTDPLPQPSSTSGFVEARKNVPGQTLDPPTAAWNSDAYFSDGAGNDIYINGTQATTNVINMTLTTDTVVFYLDPAEWPVGIYDVEIKRGATFLNSSFTSSTYTISGNVYDLYGSTAAGTLPLSRDGLLDNVNLTRMVSVRAQAPINVRNLALIYLQARNRAVNQLSVEASHYVNNWNGADWNTVETTSNCAAHYRNVLVGELNLDPLPDDLVDYEALQDWWQVCADNAYTCDLVCEGTALQDTLNMIASCGYAKSYQSEKWGIIRDYDRSAETPIQIFSTRNMKDFQWRKSFPRLPTGLLISFTDENYEFTTKQTTVYRESTAESDARIEQTAYDGIVHLDGIIQRAQFDLRQAEFRATQYVFTTAAEYLRCQRGSLIAVQHDTLQKHTGAARILSVQKSGSNITGITLDENVSVVNNPSILTTASFKDIPIVQDAGLTTSVAIRNTDGTITVHLLSNATGDASVLTFVTPVADATTTGSPFDPATISKIAEDCLVIIGISGKQYKRLVVTDIAPDVDLTATITAVDEAPQIWSN